MKYISSLLTAGLAATILLGACSKRNIKNAEGVIATFRQPVVEGIGHATRALNNNMEFTFEPNAQINVYPDSQGECMTYALTPGADASASFNVMNFNMKDAKYAAVYPSGKVAYNPTQMDFSLAGQNQAENNDASHLSAYDLNLAQANIENNTGEFNFMHKIAWLKVSIYIAEACTVHNLSLSAYEGIANTLSVNAITGEVTATPKSASEKIVLTFNGNEGFNMPARSILVAYVTIPAGTYTDLTVQCGEASKTISGSKEREEGNAYKISMMDDSYVVDLGLPSGLLWAKDNLGVETLAGYGLHYAWGEIIGYYNSNDTWTNGTDSRWFRYGSNIYMNDLSPEYDAATQAFGGKYRMPNKEDFEELIANTDYIWETRNGIAGIRFMSRSNSSKQIFLPAAGFGYDENWEAHGSEGHYRSRNITKSFPPVPNPPTYYLKFSGNVNQTPTISVTTDNATLSLYGGMSIRPVYDMSR